MKVLALADYKPHLSGEIKCIVCGHKWVGVCPIKPDGTIPCLECPECGLMQGFYFYPVLPDEGENVYSCNCGNDLFYFIKDRGARCIRCGTLHKDF